MDNEPVTLRMALTAAVVATINILGLVFEWDAELVAGLNLAAQAWVVVLALWIRRDVAPEASVRAVSPSTANVLWPGSAPAGDQQQLHDQRHD